jgi:AraC family transcriptional regulator
MSLQLSSLLDSSLADHSIQTLISSPDVGIQSLNKISTRPSIHVQIQESEVHCRDGRSGHPQGQPDASMPGVTSIAVDQLSKVLRSAGIDIRKLDRSADNAIRLAVMARLVETLEPFRSQAETPRAVAALPKWRLIRVLKYIDVHIGEPITLARLAAAAGLSRMYFAKQFRAATGNRPHDYVLRKRIERAQQMLTAKPTALVDIALCVGFQTQAHFTTVFKKIVGSTPCRWRREQPNVA